MNRLALTLRALSISAIVLASLSLPSALAEDTGRERIFLVFEGDDAGSLERESLKFQAPVLEAQRFEFAGTQEMEVLYASCNEDIGTNAETRRDCQLRAANRISVTQVLQLRGDKLDKKTWDVALEVWSPETNGLLWGATLEIEASSLRRAAREAYPELANRYLCWRGVESACPASAPVEVTAVEAKAPDGMVLVPGGKFTMGSTKKQVEAAFALCESERGEGKCKESWFSDESPQKEVDVDAFYIDAYEVTVEAYKACVDAGSCSTPFGRHGGKYMNWDASGRDNHPINGVKWSQASSYCGWVGKRLPTEAEWEKAARGTDGRKFPWGNAAASCAYAVMNDGAGEGCGQAPTSPVGSRPSGVSPYGAHDMAGNVSEWVSDWYDAGYYASAPGSNPRGPDSGSERVVRGGGYSGRAAGVRAADRDTVVPYAGADYLGFRCARSAP